MSQIKDIHPYGKPHNVPQQFNQSLALGIVPTKCLSNWMETGPLGRIIKYQLQNWVLLGEGVRIQVWGNNSNWKLNLEVETLTNTKIGRFEHL